MVGIDLITYLLVLVLVRRLEKVTEEVLCCFVLCPQTSVTVWHTATTSLNDCFKECEIQLWRMTFLTWICLVSARDNPWCVDNYNYITARERGKSQTSLQSSASSPSLSWVFNIQWDMSVQSLPQKFLFWLLIDDELIQFQHCHRRGLMWQHSWTKTVIFFCRKIIVS